MKSEDKLNGVSRFPEDVNKIQVRIEIKEPSTVEAYLLLDGERYQAVELSDHGPTSADFGIYENTPWYYVAFPGEGWEVEEDVPDEVFETLKRLTRAINEAIRRKSDVILEITQDLKSTGCDLYASLLNDKDIELTAKSFKQRSST